MVIGVWHAGGLRDSLAFIERQNEGMKGHVAAHSDAVGFSSLFLSSDVISPYPELKKIEFNPKPKYILWYPLVANPEGDT